MDRHRLGNPKNEETKSRAAAKNKENPIRNTISKSREDQEFLNMFPIKFL